MTRSTSSCLLISIFLANSLCAKSEKGIEVLIPATQTGKSPWRVSAGMMWRKTGQLNVTPNARGIYTAGLPTTTSAVGAANENANRTYTDGFVNISAATAATNLTTFWGYNNASQVSGQTISFTSDAVSTLTRSGSLEQKDQTVEAPYIEVAYLTPLSENLEAGLSLQFSFNGFSSSVSSSLQQSSVVTTDSYNVAPGALIPSAGYVGSYTGPGLLIGNQPDSRSVVSTPTTTQNYTFQNSTDVYSLALGGEIQWQPIDRVSFGASAGPVLNYVDWDAQWSSPFFNGASVAQMDFKQKGDDILYGVFTKMNASYHLNQNWSMDGFFRYDWTQSLTQSVTTTNFEVNLSGWSGGVGVSYRF